MPQTGGKASQRREGARSKPSGPQLSYFKAVEALAEHFEGDGLSHDDAGWLAREILRPALPVRQRARLDRSL